MHDKAANASNGERVAVTGACPCSKEIFNLVAKEGGNFRFGYGPKKIFTDFSKLLRHNYLPMYWKMDIYKILPKRVYKIIGSYPVIDEYFGARAWRFALKMAAPLAIGILSLAALALDRIGILKTGISQVLDGHGLEKAYTYFFGAITGIGIMSIAMNGEKGIDGIVSRARNAKQALSDIIRNEHGSDKANGEREARRARTNVKKAAKHALATGNDAGEGAKDAPAGAKQDAVPETQATGIKVGEPSLN